MRTFKHGFYALSMAVVFGGPLALAAVSPPYPPGVTSFGQVPAAVTNIKTDVPALLAAVIAWLFWALIVFAIIMFFIGGYKYVTSAGESEKVSEANKTLLYAAIAVVVALLAKGLPPLISSFFLGGGGSGGSFTF